MASTAGYAPAAAAAGGASVPAATAAHAAPELAAHASGYTSSAGVHGLSASPLPEGQLNPRCYELLRRGPEVIEAGVKQQAPSLRHVWTLPRPGLRVQSSDKPALALQQPLPQVAMGADGSVNKLWNTERCRHLTRCGAGIACPHFHTQAERRCPVFSKGENCPHLDGCSFGLHCKVEDVCRTLTIDLRKGAEVAEILRRLDAEPLNARAQYVRVVIYGFERARSTQLENVLMKTPFVHDLVLPDMLRSDGLFVMICDLVENLTDTTPRLHAVIYADGARELIWD
eukprot:TRINITY_DN55260_c0_g1_i1.p1 TRINITY_DN55260_c0_g1~~TRINITY_DN55260_c0_g1_i1.p1  ORF type:complete len:327 (-),score=57.67 TRINITY_DN55260_c0_g1_i1:20-874(-)